MADDEECPHGLDPSWCTFCRRRASGEPPAGVRRPRATATAPARASRPRTAAAARPVAVRTTPQGPADGLVKVRKVVFHAAPYGAWSSIAELGLLTPKQLLGEDARLRAIRSGPIELVHASGEAITVRDQRAMGRANIAAHLDGIDLPAWLDVLNQRTFFFAKQKELTGYLGRYQETEGVDVLAFDTARLLAAVRGRVEVSTLAVTSPVPWDRCPCRNRASFEPLDTFRGVVADIEEITVVDGVQEVAPLVARVIRYHPDRTTEILVA